jgi:hypothetical protein
MSMSDDEPADPRALRKPVNWEEWRDVDQLQHVAGQMTRQGLIEQVLLFAGRDIADREISGDTQLTKDDLAAIYLTLEVLADAE